MKPVIARLIVALIGLLPPAAEAYPSEDQQRLVAATAALQDGLIAGAGAQATAGAAVDSYRTFLKANQGRVYKDLEVRIEGVRVTGNGVVVTTDLPTPNRSSPTSRLVLVNDLNPVLLSQAEAHFLGTLKAGARLRVDGQILGVLRATLVNPDVAQLEFRFDRFKPEP